MTPHTWEQWDGIDYPSERQNPIVYYYPGTVDIEDPDNLNSLIVEMHQDGVAPTTRAARAMLEAATVVHGQVLQEDGELRFHASSRGYPDTADHHLAYDATWVEVDDYVG